jgi:hypothetical protein
LTWGVTPLFVKEVKTAARNGFLFNLAFDKSGIEMSMRHPRRLLKLSDNVDLQFTLFPNNAVEIIHVVVLGGGWLTQTSEVRSTLQTMGGDSFKNIVLEEIKVAGVTSLGRFVGRYNPHITMTTSALKHVLGYPSRPVHIFLKGTPLRC